MSSPVVPKIASSKFGTYPMVEFRGERLQAILVGNASRIFVHKSLASDGGADVYLARILFGRRAEVNCDIRKIAY